MEDQAPAPEVPVIDAEPKPEAKPSKMAAVMVKAKAAVQWLLDKIGKYPGTALLVFIASHAVKYFI
jgi:hypothetical protein